MIVARVEIPPELLKWFDGMPMRLEATFDKAVEITWEEVMKECPVRTGILKKSHRIERPRPFYAEIVADTPYARTVHFGRVRPLVIRPKRRKWMKFYWDKVGRTVYAKKVVSNPRPNPWMSRAANKVRGKIVSLFIESLRRVR